MTKPSGCGATPGVQVSEDALHYARLWENAGGTGVRTVCRELLRIAQSAKGTFETPESPQGEEAQVAGQATNGASGDNPGRCGSVRTLADSKGSTCRQSESAAPDESNRHCQYAQDVGMPEYRCAVECQYMQSATAWKEDSRPWGLKGDGDIRCFWNFHGVEIIAMSHGKRWTTTIPLPVSADRYISHAAPQAKTADVKKEGMPNSCPAGAAPSSTGSRSDK